MNKKTIRVLTDLLMFVAMCFLAGTGLLIHYRLVPGYQGGHGLTLLNLTRHEWGAYHLWAAYLLLFFVLVHLILNFTFIRDVIACRKPWLMIILGLSGLIVTLFFLIMPVERKGGDTKGHGRKGSERGANLKEATEGQP